MIFRIVIRFLAWPFRMMGRIFRGVMRSGRANGSAGRAAGRVGAGTAVKVAPRQVLDDEYREEPPSGVEAAMFKQLPRPRLTERSASDLTLEQAREHAKQSERFYDFAFPLFPRGDAFYEEIECDFLNAALGYDDNSIDRRFLDVTTLFRRTLNDNTRQMTCVWTPLVGLAAFAAAWAAAPWLEGVAPSVGPLAGPELVYAVAALVASFVAGVIYSWPYKVVQQRNLMNLDNYVTSKFARINNNFQVAKRQALNVERDKRMSERVALKEEAGVWTIAYHWFATRLFLCELLLRNKFYQVRRNTMLYWVGGVVVTGAALGAGGAALHLNGTTPQTLAVFGASALFYVAFVAMALAGMNRVMFSVVQSHEWSRFHLADLDRTIRDHVGEDKLQIVTFRDRNRIE